MQRTLTTTSKTPRLIETPGEQAPYYFEIESESRADTIYEIRYNFTYHIWGCSCPAVSSCKHLRAVHAVLAERKAAKKAQAEAQAIVADALDNPTIPALLARIATLEEALIATARRMEDLYMATQEQIAGVNDEITGLYSKASEIKDLRLDLGELTAAVVANAAKPKRTYKPRAKKATAPAPTPPATDQTMEERIAAIVLSPEEMKFYSDMMGLPTEPQRKGERRHTAQLGKSKEFSMMK